MTTKPLRIGTTHSFHALPLLMHAVDVPGLSYEAIATKTIDEATMKALKGDFDVAEMSLATFVTVREHSNAMVGLPIFARKLVSQYAYCREDSALSGYPSLKGKRIAVPQFWLTAALWHRWYLQEVFGVDPSDVIWCPLGPDRLDNMPYPKQYQIDWSLKGRGAADVLRTGDADCFIFARRPLDMTGLRYLSPNPGQDTLDLAQKTGIVPVTHVIAVQAALVADNPGLAQSLFDLYNHSLHHANGEVAHETAQFLPLGDLEQDRMARVLGASWNQYGWKPSELAVRTFCNAAVQQGMVGAVDIDRCFVQLKAEQTVEA